MKSFVFCLFVSCIVNIGFGCQVPCSSSSTACCVRGGCGCVDLLGTTNGCDESCVYSGYCCSDLKPCSSSSKACCEIDTECGCIDINHLLESEIGDASDCIAQCQHCGETDANDAADETNTEGATDATTTYGRTSP